MDYSYSEFDGIGFQSPDDLYPPQQMIQFILQYGQDGLEALDEHEQQNIQDLIQQLIDEGYLERDSETGQLRITPQMVKGIEHRALLDIFEDIKQGGRDGHPTAIRGRSSERDDGTHGYQFGDPISEIDLTATMRNAMARQIKHVDGDNISVKLPLQINHNDFELHNTDSQADCATCILIDMSGSMMRWGRFYQAKRVALGLQALVTQRFPLDTVDFVGFYSLAQPIAERDLPLVMPKPVSIRDHEVRLRMDLQQAIAEQDKIPLHFTNLHMGLRQARQILARRGAQNKQIFIITDGQPTAHIEPNPQTGGESLYLLYPPSEQTSTITLTEALRCRQAGIRIASFALIEDYWGMEWVGFINQLTRLTRGIAYYCSSDDLSSTVVESFLSGRKKKSFIG